MRCHLFDPSPGLPPRAPGSLVFDERQCVPCGVYWHPSDVYTATYGGDVCFECGGPGEPRWIENKKPRPWVEIEQLPPTPSTDRSYQ